MKLADYLKTTGQSQTEFADKIGVAQSAVARYSAGQRVPRGAILRRIAEVTESAVTANDFVPPTASHRAPRTSGLPAFVRRAPRPQRARP